MKNTCQETKLRHGACVAAYLAVLAVAVGLPAMAGVTTASNVPNASNTRATIVNTPLPDSERSLQTEGAHREAGETNDKRTDLAALLKVEDAAEAVAEGEKTGASGLTAGHQAVIEWPTVRARLSQNGVSEGALIDVDRKIAALRNDLRSHADIARAANEVTAALAPLFTRAGDKVPADVHYLDYLGRSIKLDVHSGEWQRAQREAATVQSRWAAIRSRVQARPAGAAAAAEFDTGAGALTAAVHARDVNATLVAATMIGNAVDTVEKVF